MDFFGVSLWQELAGTFVGAFLALAAHFVVTRRADALERRINEKARRNRLSMYLLIADQVINKNSVLLRQAQSELEKPDGVVLQRLNLGLLDTLIKEPLFHYLDLATANKLYEMHHDLEHLQRDFDAHFDLTFRFSHAGVGIRVPKPGGGFNERGLRQHLLDMLLPAMKNHIARLISTCADVQQEVSQRRTELSS